MNSRQKRKYAEALADQAWWNDICKTLGLDGVYGWTGRSSAQILDRDHYIYVSGPIVRILHRASEELKTLRSKVSPDDPLNSEIGRNVCYNAVGGCRTPRP